MPGWTRQKNVYVPFAVGVKLHVSRCVGPVPMPNVVPRFSETPGAIRHTGPALGEHNDDVYGNLLGLDQAERDALRADGVI